MPGNKDLHYDRATLCSVAVNDLYQALDVKRDASQNEIKRSYRKLTQKYHPDKNPGDKKAEERFKKISQAYEVLGDEEKRKNYDEFGDISLSQGFDPARARAYKQQARASRAYGGNPFGSAGGSYNFGDIGDARSTSFDDLLSKLFGGGQVKDFGEGGFGRPKSRSGRDIEGEINISLLDSLLGVTVPLRVSNDQGDARTLDVKVPQGINDGGKLRLRGQGGAGSPPGDILLTIRVSPAKILRREGDHLYLTLPITALEAYRGGPVDVPTPFGSVTVKIPPGSQNNQMLRVRGKGVHHQGKSQGDLFLTLDVRLPQQKEDADLIKALERLQAKESVRGTLDMLS